MYFHVYDSKIPVIQEKDMSGLQDFLTVWKWFERGLSYHFALMGQADSCGIKQNTILAAQGALAHRLHRRTRPNLGGS